MKKNENRRESIRSGKLITEIILSALIIGFIGYKASKIFTDFSKVDQASLNIQTETTEPTTEEDKNKVIYETAETMTKSKFIGSLILVNGDFKYYSSADDSNLVSINAQNKAQKRSSFSAATDAMEINADVYTALAAMLDDFHEETGLKVVISSGFRSFQKQEELYNADLKATGLDYSESVAKPGHSEHQTGLSVDFKDFDGEGDYAWINENAWRYGFILRYPENKTSVTNIKFEPWHFRYVGVPHAYYMHTNNLCLEEYAELLIKHSYDGEHLFFSDSNGTEYEIYFVQSDDGSDVTFVPVPSGMKYEIQGNNSSGFIVTVYVAQSPEPSSVSSEDATEDVEETNAP